MYVLWCIFPLGLSGVTRGTSVSLLEQADLSCNLTNQVWSVVEISKRLLVLISIVQEDSLSERTRSISICLMGHPKVLLNNRQFLKCFDIKSPPMWDFSGRLVSWIAALVFSWLIGIIDHPEASMSNKQIADGDRDVLVGKFSSVFKQQKRMTLQIT